MCSSDLYLISGQPLTIRIGYEAAHAVADVVCGITVYDNKGVILFGSNTDNLGIELDCIKGSGEIAFILADVPLLDGSYPVTIGLHSHDEATVYDWSEQRHTFEVMSPTRDIGVLQFHVDVAVNGRLQTPRLTQRNLEAEIAESNHN